MQFTLLQALTCSGQLSYLGTSWRKDVTCAGYGVPLNVSMRERPACIQQQQIRHVRGIVREPALRTADCVNHSWLHWRSCKGQPAVRRASPHPPQATSTHSTLSCPALSA